MVAEVVSTTAERAAGGLLPRIAWRNLWRNRRRTRLTTSSIAFAIALIVFFMSLQSGSYEDMIDLGTSLITGHAQIQHPKTLEDPDIDHRLNGRAELLARLDATPGIEAAPRLVVFALASVDERSLGAQIMGVDPKREQRLSVLPARIDSGRYLSAPGEAVVGQRLADNLGASLGGELVVLGTGADGSVAALVVEIVGLLRSGITELDRGLVQLHISDVSSEFSLTDAATHIALKGASPPDLELLNLAVSPLLAEDQVLRDWPELMPDLFQGIEIDRISGRVMYVIILAMVAFSVLNTFVLLLFERRREFGVLLALGMKPGRIILMVHLEALALWILGAGIGLGVALAVIAIVASTGISLGDDMQEMAEQMYMPSHMYPGIDVLTLTFAPLVMLFATQLAAAVGSLRLLRLRPVDAMRRT